MWLGIRLERVKIGEDVHRAQVRFGDVELDGEHANTLRSPLAYVSAHELCTPIY